ncbi:MAG: RnfABCDGE type electron transport complex subunit B [Angelakisella sp.]|nr:RnfABCDGE type electron transport complex subunit B [Angelakisella sp.]
MLESVLIVSGIGVACAVLLVVAAKLMAVKVDETAENIRAVLPGANCGACGFAGCDDYAKNLCENRDIKTNLCTPGGDATARKIAEILGVEFEDVVEMKANMKCAGNFDTSEYIMEYQGLPTCKACNTFYQGRRSCTHGCLGYGDCANVCKFGALSIENGLAVIDRDLCTGCGACARVCPNHIIAMIKETSLVHVACSSHDKGAYTRKVCKAGCIGCMKCQKTCEYGAITVTENLACIDPDKCTNCGACVEVCPTKVIHMVK